MKFCLSLLLLLALCLTPNPARAHAVSNSYLELRQTSDHVAGRWRVALRDLTATIGLDQDGDGQMDDAELGRRREAIESYLLSRLELSAGERPCPLVARGVTLDASYLVLELESACAGADSLRYDLFFDHDRSHQGHLHLAGTSEQSHIFTSERRSISLAPGDAPSASAWLEYLSQGVWHILIGADHVLFLLTLLIAAVLRHDGQRYEPVASFRSAFIGMAKIVTAFTAAHSITLTLMALGLVTLPSRWVETAIALSIVAAAANNLWPLVTRRQWLIAFAFGLIHGLGFASVLLELGLPQGRLLVALVGFNLGVEVGQLGIVAVCFPIAFWLRRRQAYRRIGLTFGSALVGVIGLVWSLERGLGASWTAGPSNAGDSAAVLGNASPREPCDGLRALSDPAYGALLKGLRSDDRADDRAGDRSGDVAARARRAFELACAGDLARSAEAYAEALAATNAATPPLALGWLVRGYAEVERARGEPDHAETLLARAERIWREQGADQPLADTLAALGELMAREESWADVYRLYDEARGLHEKAGDHAGLAKDLSRLGDVLVSAADPSAARRMYDKAKAAYEHVGDFSGVAAQYRNLAIVARLDADADTAARMYRRAIELDRLHGHQPELASDLAALARTYLGTAQYDEAKALYEQANLIEQQLGRKRALARNHNQLGNLHLFRGELDLAEQRYREGLAFSEQARDATEAANNWANLAGLYQKQGRARQAREMYERSLGLFEASGARAKVLRVQGLIAALGQVE